MNLKPDEVKTKVLCQSACTVCRFCILDELTCLDFRFSGWPVITCYPKCMLYTLNKIVF